MTLGDVLVSLGFLACFGLIFFIVRRALQLDGHLHAHHNETWKKIHRLDPRGALFGLQFLLFFGWRKPGPDPKVRSWLRDMLVAYLSSLVLIVVIVALGATLPLKVFHYTPAEDGAGGTVVLDPD
jgi:hypothetical protein